MKEIVLILFMCSATENVCMPPYVWPDNFEDEYTCMIKGYEEGKKKILDVGREDVNKHKIYVKFECQELDIILPQPKPKIQSKVVV